MRRKALVFGERSTANILARQLENEGFDPLLLVDLAGQNTLPSLADSDNLSKLRQILFEFVSLINRDAKGLVSSSKSYYPAFVHPGVTAWAERPELPIIAEEFGLTIVCPPAKVLSLFSNKLNLLLEAKKLGVPNAVLSSEPIYTTREIDDFVSSTGQKLPFVLKAVKGRGSTSLFVAKEEESLKRDLLLWFEQLRQNVGEVILFAEKYVDGARHLVVPFCRFQDGSIWTFPISDVSLQCRYRKVVEFCPARQVTTRVTRQLVQWTRLLAQEFNYVGVGAFEFLVDGSSAYLIEGLARLNAGFHLWEGVAGTSVVAWQIAALDYYTPTALPSIHQVKDSHEGLSFGVSIRIYAEDSDFHLPQPGFIHEIMPLKSPKRQLVWPRTVSSSPGTSEFLGLHSTQSWAEYSLNYRDQDQISTYDSGIIGLFFAFGSTQKEVLSLILEMITEFWMIGTIQTNQRFLFDLLQHPWVREQIFYAGFIDDEYVPEMGMPDEVRKLLLGVSTYLPDVGLSGQWGIAKTRVPLESSVVERVRAPLVWLEEPRYWEVRNKSALSGVLKSQGGQPLRVSIFPVGNYWLVRIGYWFSKLKRISERRPGSKAQSPEVSRESKKPSEPTGESAKKVVVLKALNSGRVHALLFIEDAPVPAHEPLLTLEAFGVLVPHALPVAARMVRWQVSAEDRVEEGQELAHLILV